MLGKRVTVNIKDTESWAMGTAEALNGTHGEITKVHPGEEDWRSPGKVIAKERPLLVTFDEPVNTHPRIPHWGASSAFWFKESELIEGPAKNT